MSQALSDPGLGLGPSLALASSLCEIMATPIYRTLNLGGLKFVHLLLWQSWENWATFLVQPVTLCVTLGMFSALSGPAHCLSERCLFLDLELFFLKGEVKG